MNGTTFATESSALVVDLPGEVSLDVEDLGDGPARISAFRAVVPGIDDQLLRTLLVESSRGSVDDIAAIAQESAGRYGFDGSDFEEWRRSDPTFGGADNEVTSGSIDLAPGGPSLALDVRMRSGDDAVAILGVVWPRDPATDEPPR